MLSGLKFIPRDQIDSTGDEKNDLDSRKSYKKKKKFHDSGSGDNGSERIKKRSRKKKWYSSEEDSPSYSDGSESESGRENDKRMRKERKKEKRRRKRKEYHTDSDSADGDGFSKLGKKEARKKGKRNLEKGSEDDLDGSGGESHSQFDKNRKEMGLEWMLRPKDDMERKSACTPIEPEEPPNNEVNKVNPRELNPYFKNDGTGYPEEEDGASSVGSHLLSTSVVGDGGASWRLKALKRAQEQAARDGKALDEVVGERWGSLGQLAVSVSSRTAAPSHAHLHAIRNRIKQQTQEQPAVPGNRNETDRDSRTGVSSQHAKMKLPRVDGSLSWGKQKSQRMSAKDAGVISSALSSINKFSNDGSFLREFKSQQKGDSGLSIDTYTDETRKVMSDMSNSEEQHDEGNANVRPKLSANQLAAKAMKLRMKGKVEEAEKLLKEAQEDEDKGKASADSNIERADGTTHRYIMQGAIRHKQKKEENADMHLASTIMQNKQYSISGRADDEYDYDEGPKRKKKSKSSSNPKPMVNTHLAKRILTQQERCKFCFENPSRPRHLVVAIANFTYLMLPQWQPIVPGHCCILTMQHESATRSVDDNVWDELRNFKKCLLMMFAKQNKDVIFLETVMELAKQRRHCMIECIPLPQDIAKQGPLYFKKAIDEAEEEWSQHNAKKLIDTSEKGLRGSIPKDFPYFHVEFGLKKGFVHVIDDESQFNSNFGLNVVRGMLRLPAEDMHRRHKHDSVETQKQAVASFVRDWEPYDWTKQLD